MATESEVHCPNCGHALSMFHSAEPSRAEAGAMRVADAVASWPFVATVLALIAGWVIWNVAAEPFDPYPVIIFAVISAALATVAALQGPLVLLAQQRSASRDRDRDAEILRVAANTEADLHRIESKLDALATTRDATQGTGR